MTRWTRWWTYLLPFLLGLLYLNICLEGIGFGESLGLALCFFLTFCGTIAFGYFLNDMTDVRIDLLAGKKNAAAGNSLASNLAILFLLLFLAVLPWAFLPRNPLNVALYLVQLLLLVAYSVRPLRLKRFPLACVVTDALYNSVVPLWIIFSTFFSLETPSLPLVIVVTLWAFLKGIRGILLHQINDRKNDRRAAWPTFVTVYGPLNVYRFIYRYSIILEATLFVLTAILLSSACLPYFWLLIPLFLFYLFIWLRMWEDFRRRRREFLKGFVYLLNDLYEEWLPVVILLFLGARQPLFLLLLLIHLLVFYAMVDKYVKYSKQNWINLHDFSRYAAWIVWRRLKIIFTHKNPSGK